MPLPYPLVYSTLGTPDWSLARMAEQAVADGYAGLEVRILDGQVIPPDLSTERRNQIRQILQQNGLVIAGIGASTRFSSAKTADQSTSPWPAGTQRALAAPWPFFSSRSMRTSFRERTLR